MADAVDRIAIALMVRHPVPGRVKTRLAAGVGDTTACLLYQAMVEDILAGVRQGGWPLWLFHDGGPKETLPGAWAAGAAHILPQCEGDIGQRMATALTTCYAAGWERVLVCGSDLPGLDAEVLTAAVAALEEAEAVIAPALDGGYGLIGLCRQGFRPELFQNVNWSTDQVLAQTLRHCKRLGMQVRLLEPLRDLDTMADLAVFLQNPSSSPSSAFYQALVQLRQTGTISDRLPPFR